MGDKIVTVDQVLDAIEENGLPQTFNMFFEHNEVGKIVGGCALGQAAINLGVSDSSLWNVLDFSEFENLGSRIVKMNDLQGRSLAHIAKYYRRRLTKEFRSKELILREYDYEGKVA